MPEYAKLVVTVFWCVAVSLCADGGRGGVWRWVVDSLPRQIGTDTGRELAGDDRRLFRLVFLDVGGWRRPDPDRCRLLPCPRLLFRPPRQVNATPHEHRCHSLMHRHYRPLSAFRTYTPGHSDVISFHILSAGFRRHLVGKLP